MISAAQPPLRYQIAPCGHDLGLPDVATHEKKVVFRKRVGKRDDLGIVLRRH